MNTFEGKPHAACGTTLRYVSSGKCVACLSAYGAARSIRRTERNGNYNVGLRDGFVFFNTLAHRILKHIHECGPALHAELLEALPGERGVSTNLVRLVKHGFLYHVDRQSHRPGQRSGHVFGLTRPHRSPPPRALTTKDSRQNTYRASQRMRVPSVFEFRGRIDL